MNPNGENATAIRSEQKCNSDQVGTEMQRQSGRNRNATSIRSEQKCNSGQVGTEMQQRSGRNRNAAAVRSEQQCSSGQVVTKILAAQGRKYGRNMTTQYNNRCKWRWHWGHSVTLVFTRKKTSWGEFPLEQIGIIWRYTSYNICIN